MDSKHHELRCFCARAPLLATYGIDLKGLLFVHVRVYKQRRIFGEVIVTGGTVRLHCRECLRWQTVVIRQPGSAGLIEDSEPPMIPGSDGMPTMLADTPTSP